MNTPLLQPPIQLHPFWFYLACALIGAVGSAVVLLLFFKYRREQLTWLKALVGGLATPSLAGAATKISALFAEPELPLSWLDAFVLTLCWFLMGIIGWTACGFLFFHYRWARPLRQRHGVDAVMRAWYAFLTGSEGLKTIQDEYDEAKTLNDAWDELACAAKDFDIELKKKIPAEVALVLQTLEQRVGADMVKAEDAIELTTRLIAPPLKTLCARLSKTTLNFTVWRIHADQDILEHLLSFPIETEHGPKRPLQIWLDADTKREAGSVAARALLNSEYKVLKAEDPLPHGWDRRRLGEAYHEVSASPIDSSDQSGNPWGVLCIESREGTIPLASGIIRRVASDLANTLGLAAFALRERNRSQLHPNISRS